MIITANTPVTLEMDEQELIDFATELLSMVRPARKYGSKDKRFVGMSDGKTNYLTVHVTKKESSN